MPYVQLPSEDVALYYRIAGTRGQDDLDRDKPTILYIHGVFLDSECFHKQYEDTRLRRRFNSVSFDMRSHGKTRSTVSERYDTCVAAADIAIAMDILQLPQCHVLGGGAYGSAIALRLAALFPEKVLSLILTGAPSPEDSETNVSHFSELSSFWLTPHDFEEFLHGVTGALFFCFGPEDNIPVTEHDGIAETFIGRYPPTAASRMWECCQPCMARRPLPEQLLAGIRQPVMIVQGENDAAWPPKVATELAASLRGTAARLEVVSGAPQNLFYTHPAELNLLVLQFLTSVEFPALDYCAPRLDLRGALHKIAVTTDDPTRTHLGRARALDFSVVPTEQLRANREHLSGLLAVQQANSTLLPFPTPFWNEHKDVPLAGFRFSARHEYLEAVRRARDEGPPQMEPPPSPARPPSKGWSLSLSFGRKPRPT